MEAEAVPTDYQDGGYDLSQKQGVVSAKEKWKIFWISNIAQG